jgi:hypothetical protein
MKQDREERQASMIPALLANTPPGNLAKPGELIDFSIDGLDKLTKADLDIENRLLRGALEQRDRVQRGLTDFMIPMSALRRGRSDNDRVFKSLKRLQKTVMQVRDTRGGFVSVQKLGSVKHGGSVRPDEADSLAPDVPFGFLRYSYDRDYFDVMYRSTFWGMLDVDLMAQLPSKYAYRMFEVTARRINMRHVRSELFKPAKMRDIVLGVPRGKLASSNDLWRYAIAPAVKHVNALAPFQVEVEPVVEKRIVTGYLLHWDDPSQMIEGTAQALS